MNDVAELVQETKRSCLDYLPKLIGACEDLAERLQLGAHWLDLFQAFVDGLSWLNQAFHGIQALEPHEAEGVDVAPLKDVLAQLEGTLKNQDLVYLADVLQYELKPLLENYLTFLQETTATHVS